MKSKDKTGGSRAINFIYMLIKGRLRCYTDIMVHLIIDSEPGTLDR